MVISRCARRLERLPATALLMIGLACVASIGLLDYVTGPRIYFGAFYLLPVLLVAWASASLLCGLVVALAVEVTNSLVDSLQGVQQVSLWVTLWNAGLRLAVIVIVLVLLQHLRRANRRLLAQATTDSLTGLVNLRGFGEICARELERSARYRRRLVLAYLDLDDFKAVNDRFGHAAGDRVLIALASLAKTSVRAPDTVARVGGDEFAILMPETDLRAAQPALRRLLEALPEATVLGDVSVTCSVGLAAYLRVPASPEEMFADADRLMYEAKARGGNELYGEVIASLVRSEQVNDPMSERAAAGS